MRILVGYEKTGAIRRILRALGYEAFSCDVQSSDDKSPHHIKADIWTVANDPWDLGIFHPVCTYLTTSAMWAYKDPDFDRYPETGYHQKVKPGTLTGAKRRKACKKELENFMQLDQLPYPTVLENPGMSLIASNYRQPDQIIQPYQFGDDASKATGLWLSGGLAPLDVDPRLRCPGRVVEYPVGSGNFFERWSNQTDSGQNKLPESVHRQNKRSETYSGIAKAIAEQIPMQIINPYRLYVPRKPSGEHPVFKTR